MKEPMKKHSASLSVVREPRLWEAMVPVLALIAFIGVNVMAFAGSAHLPLILAAIVAGGVGLRLGFGWGEMEKGVLHGIQIGLKAILILMVIGIMIGTWVASGIVPILIYYGLEVLNPRFFLAAACLLCSVVSVATGSSWTTAGTVGVALIGIAQGLDVPVPMAAGAVVSGAYFGDKMSPLSDTTNLAPAVAGSELFEHIRHMTYTTLPALGLALLLYTVLGFRVIHGAADLEVIREFQTVLTGQFSLTPWLLLPPLLVIAMVIWRIPALPALLGGAILGGLCAAMFQGVSLQQVLQAAQSGYISQTGVQEVDELLTRGGLDSMMNTVSLILCALAFGGLMEKTGQLAAIAQAVLRLARSTGRLISATVFSCIAMNLLAADQYLSIIVPGRMYREAFHRAGLEPKNLSRTLEDAGTLSSPLVPWNTCGAFMTGALLVSPVDYLPYAFLNLLTPLVAIFLGFTGWTLGVSPKRQKPG